MTDKTARQYEINAQNALNVAGRHSAPRKEIPLLKIGEAIGWGLLAVSQRLGKLLERQELEDERQELLRERT